MGSNETRAGPITRTLLRRLQDEWHGAGVLRRGDAGQFYSTLVNEKASQLISVEFRPVSAEPVIALHDVFPRSKGFSAVNGTRR